MDDAEHVGLTPLEVAAAQAHELFMSLMAAGFTEQQALAVVIGLIAQNQRQAE